MKIVRTPYSLDESYKVEVMYRSDNLYQIQLFHLEEDDHPVEGATRYWSPISRENVLTDTLDNAMRLAEETLKEVPNH